MSGRDYYNEHDPFAAVWLRELIAAGEIPAGDVDERSIEDVHPADLVGYRHCHFFAGIGGWAYAMRLAEWPDDVPLWTGSCPCQPFSAAGQGAGFTDERHLWPAFFWLIQQCRPRYVCGEQVASADALRWWDLVATDLESEAYACTAVDLPAASVGAPHKRSRLFWLADADGGHASAARLQRGGQHGLRTTDRLVDGATRDTERAPGPWTMADATQQRRAPEQRHDGAREPHTGRHVPDRVLADARGERRDGQPIRLCERRPLAPGAEVDGRGDAGGELGDTDHERLEGRTVSGERAGERAPWSASLGSAWADCIWLPCTDGKARPTQPGIQPLASRVPNRVGTLRGAGNAIVPQAAAEVLRAWREVMA